MISANPFVIVDKLNEALDYYQTILGGEIKILNQQKEKIMHAELHLGSTLIHFSDSYGQPYTAGDNVKIILLLESDEQINQIYNALKADGSVTVELQDTFFGATHGQVLDKNNINWVLNYFKA
jgi:PhnB protein